MRVAFSRRRNAAASGGVSLASSYSRNKGYAHRKIMQMNANRWQQGTGRWREAGVCISRRMPRALYTRLAGQSAFKLKAARWKYIGWKSDSESLVRIWQRGFLEFSPPPKWRMGLLILTANSRWSYLGIVSF